MKKFTLIMALIGAGSSSLFANTTYAFLDAQQPNLNGFDGTYVSPYSGAFGSSSDESKDTAVQLFCDDYVDHSTFGSSWTADITSVSLANATDTRYGGANENIAYPSGTALYQQIAWLFTQTLVPGQTTANQDQIQEAVWLMTAPKSGNTVTSTPTNAGLTNDKNWITAAQSYYLDTANSAQDTYAIADYSKWVVVTDTNTVGLPSGQINSGGTGTQEFLAYSGSKFPGTGPSPTPEPATFALFGSALLALGFFRRQSAKQ